MKKAAVDVDTFELLWCDVTGCSDSRNRPYVELEGRKRRLCLDHECELMRMPAAYRADAVRRSDHPMIYRSSK